MAENNIKRAQDLAKKYAGFSVEDLLRALLCDEFPGKIALVSSFGAEAAVLLYFAAKASPDFPVVFLDTYKLFPETLAYRDKLIDELGLTNVKTIYPDYVDLSRSDADGTLWQKDPRMCCTIRKVRPLQRALKGYDAWITGRKRYHGGMRTDLPFFEAADGRIKINPLYNFGREKVKKLFEEKNIPYHPLALQGYTSIGCDPCTAVPADPDNPRSGRWEGQDKDECGIHLENGKFVRTND